MKFKVLSGTPLFEELHAVSLEMGRCNKEAHNLVKSIGYDFFRIAQGVLAGGVSSIQIDDNPGYGWKRAYANRVDNEWFPSNVRKNKILLEKIEALPVVKESAINKPLEFDWQKLEMEGNSVIFHPGVYWRKDVILISVKDRVLNYKPVPDMIEITVCEFEQLKGCAE